MESISHAPAESSSSSASSTQHKIWMEAQDELKQKLIAQDDFPWRSATTAPPTSDQEEKALKYVGGVDISYSKELPSMACGTLVVLDIHSLQVVYEDYSVLTLSVPYGPGFLAFREAPVLLELLEKMKAGANLFYPQLHHVDGLTLSGVRQLLKAKEDCAEDFINLTGRSGHIWGVAMRSTDGSVKPIFISIGHRISLDTAIKIVKLTCKYRVPEPIRQADIRSREYLRKHQAMINK
ncbi:uncharacterized protein LOC133738697 isoform X3 [Rosa rugosa]|uniref:uncharacterized protein LOC133738697 isoform X3 n=1 Tax=Rosa rugosa TaxID=74645 RepID=UPI002B40FDEB|nr:uncharacterized protein LOC133738697 isoform X3 [Rosa rugosa]